ncbi:UDP-glucuronosyltransferase 2B7-like [Folsomia candida]|uniref:UDP-glucuronosyltransferase 2B7-like n=1 Tax=Folsomia candida TaxID=158441 RepID=UPI0016052560|nr:UDP-glucuronosyltransferase 2B7-like [Folsomia candida]XP_035706973.1 UDP-glucuronosyltransferase 2B7-like [Folsomia candida]XP_035706974.1 UDP-glucuronosyltransferase 2B7-like [Folsomia candida]XP_035706975.1 UDP-glucuronosyltransferase 2B7-like [Folsomia candida]XP_035706976.1 UDP-glucuronosyltransferase 2B7-like [Folsomia candida]
MYLNYGDEMTFTQRFVNFGLNQVLDAVRTFYYLPAMEGVYKEKLGLDAPSVGEIFGRASLLLSNGHVSINRPKPNLPNVIQVGGMHSRKAKELPKKIQDFLSSGGDDGFILFSLGTYLPSSAMSPQKRAIFVNVFSRLKQKVIWKYESNDIPDLQKNILLSKYLPQQDLLGHDKIRLFITHCGTGSWEEAIFHGVPQIGIPFFGEQPLNARTAENRGYLVRLDWNELTEERLMEAIQEVISNPKYRDNVKQLSAIFRDQIDNPLDRAVYWVYWVEYVMRHKGAYHLRSAARNLSLIQYHSLDVIAVYSLILISFFFVLCLLIKCILSLFRSCWFTETYKYKTNEENLFGAMSSQHNHYIHSTYFLILVR